MLIDTHCHIHDLDYPLGPNQTLLRAKQQDVLQVIVIGTCPSNAKLAQSFASQHPDVFWSYGYHPSEIAETIDFSSDQKLVSIGEIGLDYHYQPYDRSAQIRRLEMMLEIATQYKLPVNFHVREAFEDFWPILDNFHLASAVLHSFSDSPSNLNQALDRGLYIGVNGLATFADIPLAPLDRIVLETDAPFLTPRPFRGQPNEPAFVRPIAEYLAARFNLPFETIATQTTHNAQQLFRLPPPEAT